MAQQVITIGTNPNDDTGELLRSGGSKINNNFTELYAIQSQTINAGSVDYYFTGASYEQRIALADADAVLRGFSILYIPAFMLPYNITLCPATAGIQRVREGGDWSVYDVRAYGATADGLADDTAPIQAAIDAAAQLGGDGIRRGRGNVYISPGSYRITATLHDGQVIGMVIRGAGRNVTTIIVDANLTSALDLEGFAYGSVSDMSWRIGANRAVTNVIYIHYDGVGTRTSAGWTLERMFIGDSPGATNTFVTGVAIGTNNTLQNDTASIRHVTVSGLWTAGNTTTYQVGMDFANGAAGNTLNISLYDVQNSRLRYGIRALGAGAINGFGMFFATCGMDINAEGTQAELLFQGIRSETGQQLISASTTSGSTSGIHLSDVTWECESLTAATHVIQIRGSGVAVLDNISFQTVGAFCPKITLEAGGGAMAGKSCLIINGLTTGAFTPAQTFATCFGPVIVTGYVQTTTGLGSSPTSMIPFLIHNNAGFFTPTIGATIPGIALGVISPTEAVLVSGVDVRPGNYVNTTVTAARLVGVPLSPTIGQEITWEFTQGGAGGFALTWNAIFKLTWSDTGNTTGKRSSITTWWDGTNHNQKGAQAPYV